MGTDSEELNFPAPLRGDRLSIWTLIRVFRWKILVTWTLTILETAMLAQVSWRRANCYSDGLRGA